jgi:hypothetical protein
VNQYNQPALPDNRILPEVPLLRSTGVQYQGRRGCTVWEPLVVANSFPHRQGNRAHSGHGINANTPIESPCWNCYIQVSSMPLLETISGTETLPILVNESIISLTKLRLMLRINHFACQHGIRNHVNTRQNQ